MNSVRKSHLLALALFSATALLFSCDKSPAPETEITHHEIQTDSLSLSVPNPSWNLHPSAAYQMENEIWCIYQLEQSDGMFAQVITERTAEMKLSAPNLPIKHFVLGKTWSWKSDPKVIFIDSLDELNDQLSVAKPIAIVSQEI